MILGACTGLSCCYLAVASAKPNSSKSNGSSSAIRHGLCCPTGGYSGVLSMSTLKMGKNTVVAGAGDEGFTYRGAPGIGGFGGFFPIDDGSYLVASTDGVGTKLMPALETGILDTIGIDLVAMSVNDIVTSGTKPLIFLDYYATGHLDVDDAEKVIRGIVDGCKQAGCDHLGGETAEMPGLYREGHFDLSGCAVGTATKDSIIDGKNIIH